MRIRSAYLQCQVFFSKYSENLHVTLTIYRSFYVYSAPGKTPPVNAIWRTPESRGWVYRDEISGKVSVLGMSSVIGATEFPWTHPGIVVYAALSDGRETAVQVRLIDADESREPVWETETVVDFPDPITELELVVFLDEVVFQEPGDYRLQLYGAPRGCSRRTVRRGTGGGRPGLGRN